MGSIILEFYKRASSISHANAKALANFMLREVIEDVHVKYKISQEDMKHMNKTAVDRAALYLNKICDDPKMKKAFLIEAATCADWDDPEETAEIKEEQEFFEKLAKELD